MNVRDLRQSRGWTQEQLAEQTGLEVGCVSTGPERNETIIVSGSKLERLLR